MLQTCAHTYSFLSRKVLAQRETSWNNVAVENSKCINAFLFLGIVLLALAEDTADVKKFFIKLDNYTRLIEDQGQVIKQCNNQTEVLKRTTEEQHAKINRLERDVQALLNKTEGESENLVSASLVFAQTPKNRNNIRRKENAFLLTFLIEKKKLSLFTVVAFHAFLTTYNTLDRTVKETVKFNQSCSTKAMGELTKNGDGWVDQIRRCLSWPIMEMGELTNHGDGWVDQIRRCLSWPIMEMGELTNHVDGWVDQSWRWVIWPMVERVVNLPVMEMHELTSDTVL